MEGGIGKILNFGDFYKSNLAKIEPKSVISYKNVLVFEKIVREWSEIDDITNIMSKYDK